MGNFLNQEILGRPTQAVWGMYSPAIGSALLHPVALYEAALEGIVLFLVLLMARKRGAAPGRLTALFLFCYAAIRYLAENFRSVPAPQELVVDFFTLGQTLSFAMVLLGILVLLLSRKRMVY